MLKLSSIHALCSAATISFAHASLRAALLGCLSISASVSAAPIVTEFALLTAIAQPRGIVTGADGNIWLTQIAGGKIGRMTTAGALTEFIPLRGGVPLWTVMPDGTWTGNTYADAMYSVTGSPWVGTIYDLKRKAVTAVGTISLQFITPNNATMTYNFTARVFAGTTEAKQIVRQSF